MLWGYYDCLLDLLEKIIDTDQYQASLSVRHSIIHTIALKTSIDSSRAASLYASWLAASLADTAVRLPRHSSLSIVAASRSSGGSLELGIPRAWDSPRRLR